MRATSELFEELELPPPNPKKPQKKTMMPMKSAPKEVKKATSRPRKPSWFSAVGALVGATVTGEPVGAGVAGAVVMGAIVVPAGVGGAVPASVGGAVPASVGGAVPASVGGFEPASVGGFEPASVGPAVGGELAVSVGAELGTVLGVSQGGAEGTVLGTWLGPAEGTGVGPGVMDGAKLGSAEGTELGALEDQTRPPTEGSSVSMKFNVKFPGAVPKPATLTMYSSSSMDGKVNEAPGFSTPHTFESPKQLLPSQQHTRISVSISASEQVFNVRLVPVPVILYNTERSVSVIVPGVSVPGTISMASSQPDADAPACPFDTKAAKSKAERTAVR